MLNENWRIVPPPPLRNGEEPQYSTKDQEFVPADEISVRTLSKEEMIEERSQLAAEILSERREGRENLKELNDKILQLSEAIEYEKGNIEEIEFDLLEVEGVRADRANSLSGKFKQLLNIETADDEHVAMVIEAMRENLEFSKTKYGAMTLALEESTNELIDVDIRLKSLKDKIAEHYEEVRESVLQTVEQSIVRNNVFFVHTINEDPRLRHNAFSNVSESTTFEDDLDIFLSLEPSVSASSVTPGTNEEGKVSGLWSDTGGFLIGRGKISGASQKDMDTQSHSIKYRHAVNENERVTSHEQIDSATQRERYISPETEWKQTGGYNEFVIDNPEAIGYFKKCFVDENGWFWTSETERNQYIESKTRDVDDVWGQENARMLANNVAKSLDKLKIMRERGLPFYIMTPDRHFFEVLRIEENGQILVGEELTPEKAARANAGLPPEERKKLGKQVLEKNVFRHHKTMNEARQIIEEL